MPCFCPAKAAWSLQSTAANELAPRSVSSRLGPVLRALLSGVLVQRAASSQPATALRMSRPPVRIAPLIARSPLSPAAPPSKTPPRNCKMRRHSSRLSTRFRSPWRSCSSNGLNSSAGMLVFSSTLQSSIPEHVRGRVFTLFDVTWSAARLLSLAVGAVLVDRIGIRPVYWIGGTLLTVTGIIGLALLGRYDFRRDGPDPGR